MAARTLRNFAKLFSVNYICTLSFYFAAIRKLPLASLELSDDSLCRVGCLHDVGRVNSRLKVAVAVLQGGGQCPQFLRLLYAYELLLPLNGLVDPLIGAWPPEAKP
jgi:hypothetical protein